MVIQFLGHKTDGCLDWFDTTDCATPSTPTPITTCQVCNGEGGTPCWNSLMWIRMNWSSDAQCNGVPFIGGPLDLYFVFTNDTTGYWLFSTSTSAGYIYCDGGQWIFSFQNTAQGLWTVEGILGNVADMQDPCNILGLTGIGTITWNVVNCDPGQSTVNLSVEAYPCPQ